MPTLLRRIVENYPTIMKSEVLLPDYEDVPPTPISSFENYDWYYVGSAGECSIKLSGAWNCPVAESERYCNFLYLPFRSLIAKAKETGRRAPRDMRDYKSRGLHCKVRLRRPSGLYLEQ